MRTAEEILDRNGFDFKAFEYENEYSAKNLINAINEARKEAIEEIRSDIQSASKYNHLGIGVNDRYFEKLINELK